VQDSTRHYADMFAAGQQILGQIHYPSMQAYAQAFADPASPAARFAKYRTDPNPEADTSYLTAFGQAAAVLGSSRALAKWQADIAGVQTDLAAWVGAAVRYQQGDAGQGAVDAAAAKVTAALTVAQTDAAAVGT
jgi:hypothetical protein